MKNTAFYSITTCKFNLRCGHIDWLQETQQLYNEVLAFYYQLYLDRMPEEKNSQNAMRRLEKMTIPGRDGKPVSDPLPWEKVPLYFRRAAINAAIAAGKSFLERETQQERTARFQESVTYYKGTYRDLCETSVKLKVWNGQTWSWLHCRLSGNTLPQDAQCMSPALVLRGAAAELHVPVRTEVADGRTAKARMQANEKLCSVMFTNKDAAAVCCVLDETGAMKSSLYIKGGSEYAHRCAQTLKKLEHSLPSTRSDGNQKANQRYWMKLKHLNEYYSHYFSRKIIDYCLQQDAKILVLPKFAKPYSDYLMLSAGNWSPLHLSGQIREKLKYKSWQSGIVVLEADEHHISSVCSICGAAAKRKGQEFFCENGHRGDVYLNMAKNLGMRCRGSFGEG